MLLWLVVLWELFMMGMCGRAPSFFALIGGKDLEKLRRRGIFC